ncbi:hypothetical protein [Butyricicoccus sp.]|uniref:hypothetical protein n=1 Tax=Butyricicoccus sp. TaxID=2049021 RepID=UPI003F18CF57
MKRGYHSTQNKAFGTIPYSEFIGIALGYAIGMFFTGFFHMEGYVLEIAGAVIGFAAGWHVDEKYFQEKDVPVEEIEQLQNADDAECR